MHRGAAGARARRSAAADASSARSSWRAVDAAAAGAGTARWEGLPLLFTVLGDRRGGRRVAVRDHPDVPDPLERADDRVGASRTRRSSSTGRDIYIARGLLQLPLADDPADPRRDRALRRVQQARRVRLRPPVPVGLAPHRAGSRARGRQVPATSGTCATWRTRARSRRSRSCRRTRGCRRDRIDFAGDRARRRRRMATLGVPYTRDEVDAARRAGARSRRRQIAHDDRRAGRARGARGQAGRRADRVPAAARAPTSRSSAAGGRRRRRTGAGRRRPRR